MGGSVIQACSTCVFAQPVISDVPDQGPIMKCHRYPPLVVFNGDGLVQVWPDADEWCGEYAS